jgi:hypothetical protein
MEDYELLSQLKSKAPDKALSIIEKVFRAFNDYDKDVTNYRKARALLLHALDGL